VTDANTTGDDVQDGGVMDADGGDTGPWKADTWKNDTTAPPADVIGDGAGDAGADTKCDKPDLKDAATLLGTPCPGAFRAICDDKGQVALMCQGGKWINWTGGKCGCFHTSCGPDTASCIAIGFVGIARAGRSRKVGRLLRKYA